MRIVELAPDAWLLYTESPLELAAAIPRTGLDEIVPGADCVLVAGPASAAIAANPPRPVHLPTGQTPVELPARFDGQDLPAVAQTTGLTTDVVIHMMLATTFTVGFCGFAPGFAYLIGLPSELHVPRRSRPRPRVPAGAIAIASGYAAVYPTASPGGWHLLGTSSALLFDAHAEPPALLSPGTRVRFV